MNINELVERRKKLNEQWDKLGKEIQYISEEIEETILKNVIELGLYEAEWKHWGPQQGLTSFKDEFTIENNKIFNKISEYLNKVGFKTLALHEGVSLYLYPGTIKISISVYNKIETKDIIKLLGIKVKSSQYDELIKELTDKRNKIYG
jgi:hypothetical protein